MVLRGPFDKCDGKPRGGLRALLKPPRVWGNILGTSFHRRRRQPPAPQPPPRARPPAEHSLLPAPSGASLRATYGRLCRSAPFPSSTSALLGHSKCLTRQRHAKVDWLA